LIEAPRSAPATEMQVWKRKDRNCTQVEPFCASIGKYVDAVLRQTRVLTQFSLNLFTPYVAEVNNLALSFDGSAEIEKWTMADGFIGFKLRNISYFPIASFLKSALFDATVPYFSYL